MGRLRVALEWPCLTGKKNKNKNKNNSTALGLSERNDGNSPSSDLSRYLNYLEEIIIAIYQYSGRTDKKAGWYHKHRRDGVCLHNTARLDLCLYTRVAASLGKK